MSKAAILYTVLLIGLYLVYWQSSKPLQPKDVPYNTSVEKFTPVNLNTIDTLDGECWGSVASESQDAFRCTSDSAIYDPCFKVGDDLVECYISPVDLPTARMKIITYKDTERASISTEQRPWSYILDENIVCTVMTGTGLIINGKSNHLSCVADEGNFYGEVEKFDRVWFMNLFTSDGVLWKERVPVEKAYL